MFNIMSSVQLPRTMFSSALLLERNSVHNSRISCYVHFHPLLAVGKLSDHWEFDEIHWKNLSGSVSFSRYDFHKQLNTHYLCRTNSWVAGWHVETCVKDSPLHTHQKLRVVSLCKHLCELRFSIHFVRECNVWPRQLERLSDECLQSGLDMTLLNITVVKANEQITVEMERFELATWRLWQNWRDSALPWSMLLG